MASTECETLNALISSRKGLGVKETAFKSVPRGNCRDNLHQLGRNAEKAPWFNMPVPWTGYNLLVRPWIGTYDRSGTRWVY